MAMSDPQISLLRAGASVVRSVVVVRRPAMDGTATNGPDPHPVAIALKTLEDQGGAALQDVDALLAEYLLAAAEATPSELAGDHALAFWINVYNAGALRLAARSERAGHDSVLRQPGAFTDPFLTVEGERLSLDGVEHGKVRRFGDPRIHAALVCGSTSCPTLRAEPFEGARIDAQLDEQMRSFLADGGATWDGERLILSKVFEWYSGDFGRSHRMPSLLPSSRTTVVGALIPWLPEDLRTRVQAGDPDVAYAPYDWGLRCSLA